MISPVAKLPYVELGRYPTPLMDAARLSKALYGPRILMKREDLCGLALGGNKIRKFQFLLADIKQRGFDTVVANAGPRSNHCVQLAAAVRRLGMQATFLLVGERHEVQGNPLLQNIFGLDVRYLGSLPPPESDPFGPAMVRRMNEVADELREKGRKPFVTSHHHMPLLITGWVRGAEEIHQQLQSCNVASAHLFLADASGGTHAGLLAGTKHLNAPLKIIGIDVLRGNKAEMKAAVAGLVREQDEFLNLGVSATPDEIVVYDDYIGTGHHQATKDGIAAIRLVAETEGIVLDPIHTGKAMAGLITLIKTGQLTSRDTVVFLHTGGIANVFALHDEFAQESR